MSAATQAQPAATPIDDLEGDEYYRLAIRSLIDGGMQLVRELVEDPAATPIAKAEPYERYARALRRSIMLARHVDESPVRPARTSNTGRALAQRTAQRSVEDAIETVCADTPERAESLRDELRERLDDPAFQRDLATRPLGDIITDLKRDFGLADTDYIRYPRRTPADIQAAAPSATSTPISRRPVPPAAAFDRPSRYAHLVPTPPTNDQPTPRRPGDG